MAFDVTNFAPAGGQSTRGTAPAKWTYSTDDAGTAVDASGYFNDASTYLSVGDIIEVVTTTSNVPTGYGIHVVLSNASGVVDTSNTAAGATSLTDSD